MNEKFENNLNIVANLSQLISIYLLLKDVSNNDLMQELQNQDTNYFKEILEKLNDINKKLDKIISD